MWVHNLNPVLLSLGPLEIRYYGLAYVLSAFIVWWFLSKFKEQVDLTKEDVENLVFYIVVGVLVGSRLFSVFFWEPVYYLQNPIRILYIWQGGMAFHGGLIGIFVAVWYFTKKYRKNFWKIVDLVAAPALFGLALGRIANFINGELWGTITQVPWCVVFPNIEGCRHPVVLYGAIGRFFLSFSSYVLWKKKLQPGFVFWNFMFFIGLGRFLTDFLREDVLHFGLSLGQWYSLVIALIGAYFIITKYKESLKQLLKN